ncbi:uncharacterized protein LOC107850311 isoform X1 [Capsicum annuum]|uniref:uncharacterized protein LOC107850311 isoform X1 n=1 Tax=Capsicum annuum TaxID=4072 RepID=UPI001FB0CD0C|nr:uncharacterized protein LOC107850311 isoform X1 [Capsicum annuum]XP_047256368.1 uncharacterized protein LOC107850311 isoform X1 [Capsicum annuum]
MRHRISNYFIVSLIILTCGFLVVFALCIFQHMNDISFRQRQHNVFLCDTVTHKRGISVMMHLVISFEYLDMLFSLRISFLANTMLNMLQNLSFLYKFDDDVVATDFQLESSKQPMDYDNGDLQPSSDPPLEYPEQPMNNGNEALQPSSLSGIDSTSSFLSSEEGSSHPVTPPRRSSRTNRHAPERLGYSPGKFGAQSLWLDASGYYYVSGNWNRYRYYYHGISASFSTVCSFFSDGYHMGMVR